ncbi:hypothetical protein NECID01_1741 [Nematocida sp. AWRm77]|nr:hypothetical protein NECID01_1741 [Nematocida sp. AWRm77]
MNGEKITLEPSEILIERKTKEGKLTLKNMSSEDYGFKIKTTHPTHYNVRPCLGVVERGKAVEVYVVLLRPEEYLGTHKFQIQLVMGSKILLEKNLSGMFSLPGIELIEKKISIRYMDEITPTTVEGFKIDSEKNLLLFVCGLIIMYYLLILLRKLVFGV